MQETGLKRRQRRETRRKRYSSRSESTTENRFDLKRIRPSEDPVQKYEIGAGKEELRADGGTRGTRIVGMVERDGSDRVGHLGSSFDMDN